MSRMHQAPGCCCRVRQPQYTPGPSYDFQVPVTLPHHWVVPAPALTMYRSMGSSGLRMVSTASHTMSVSRSAIACIAAYAPCQQQRSPDTTRAWQEWDRYTAFGSCLASMRCAVMGGCAVRLALRCFRP
jgi:hypothetical protein